MEEHIEEKKQAKGNKIRILDKDTINKIAAGEVIERPASVVKELIDNSIDAGATDIRIEIEKGGKRSILIRDNGCGMSRGDALLAYKKHATSKLTRIEDLNTISTMGFRGEALSSITAVAKVEILTRPPEEITGTRIVIQGGKVLETSDAGTAPGTSVHVKDLFYNTPARQKYLKSDRTELAHITDTIMQLALANPEISFTLLSEGKPVIRNAGSSDPFKSIVNLLGPDTARSMLPLEYRTEDFEILGYISKPETTRRESDQIFLFVNTRPVTSRAINKAIREGYYTKIPKERYPVAVLSLIVDPGEVDVNVHPRKAEVRFSREKELGDAVTFAIEKVLSENVLAPEIRDKRDRTFQKTFKASGSSGILQVSEAAEIFGRKDVVKDIGIPDTGLHERGKVVKDKSETYVYPVKDTERRLKRSERLLDLTAEGEAQEISGDKKLGIKTEQEREREKEEEREKRVTDIQENQTEKTGLENKELGDISTEKGSKLKKSNTNSFENLRVIGQVSKLYILAERGEDLVLIDQHAAHERILYEQVLKMKKSGVQELIIPVTIDLTPKEKVLMEEYIPYLEECGFGISEFGDNTYVVTFIPEVFGRLEDPEIIHDVVSDLLASGKVKKDTGISERVCKTIACRAAIKGGAACSPKQMEELIEQLKKAENPYSCPHGRPTVITFTKGELDRMFARIQ
ncbi:DNA mismatch repair endonuclease MutL [Methanosarcina sp.]|uniref:DNA mismatch repair endonuclease MutL n=1 Tax=Methanosarcina sp. TaxID=2213 RepID=UPI00298953DE|nr:DNA mismatch repair endonuclease MutL [Methanosarcina sp.]MDW5549540.1 DNA mismatch repair endonuclease MutL [Methanosarcina sp.]MDW5553573.1 DNA mismatch repair endonuclease MutL [Methanosarcina sp.]MDW5558622.1 DNA mismatch repair endonuclease MutL [Methanosarcina sp.]